MTDGVDPEGSLLEREEVLAQLHAALDRSRAGRGGLALVTGEAGAGKSCVILEFLRQAAGRPFVLRGACDPLLAPRPLGPLIDAVGEVDPVAAQRLAAGTTRAEAFAIALSLVDGSRNGRGATVFVIEDAHWADDATLDLLTFLARRITNFPALLVASYREEEVGAHHPLRIRLGELASAVRCRVHVPPLSAAAVGELAVATDVDPAALYRISGGNAFFVTELLGTGCDALPESVRDAVLARAARLRPAARDVLDAAAVVPGRAERWLLEAIAGGGDVRGGLESCMERGLLRPDTGELTTFRHELARKAIVEAQDGARRREFHARALAALRLPPVGLPDPARLAFHAVEADDGVAVLEHAPVAAGEAAALGGHREAARHLVSALGYRHLAPPAECAALLVRLGREQMMLGQWEAAAAVWDDAAEMFTRLGDVEGRVEATVRSAAPLVMLGRQPEAVARVNRATGMLDQRGPSRAAALTATALSGMHMLAREFGEAEVAGQRALALARAIGDARIEAEVCIQSGIALGMSGDDAGLARIRHGITIAEQLGDDALVSLGYSQIGSGYGELRRYEHAVPALREGIAFAEAREIATSIHYMRAWLARCELELGHWDEAATIADSLVHNPRCGGVSRFVALITLGWLRARRGDPDVRPLLDEALELARATGHLQRIWPVAACRAEVAWLEDRLDDERDLLTEAATLATRLDYRIAIEELAHWERVLDGTLCGDPENARTPFGLSAAGHHDLAAGRWCEIGCPYEMAMACFIAGGVDDLGVAYRTFDALGAKPMRARTAAALRRAGAPVPRGPTPATRDNPHSLTDRELDVLRLIATGRTDRAIAGELGISAKTVGHHVSHVLSKLEVHSRAEAAVLAERLGLTVSG